MIQIRICSLFGIRYPVIQGGRVWCSGWRIAAAVSNGGGLGLIGAGSMHPDTQREHINRCRQATDKPFAVNIPQMYPQIDEGIFEGDLREGELEIGQIASHIREILPAGEVMRRMMEEYHQVVQRLSAQTFA